MSKSNLRLCKEEVMEKLATITVANGYRQEVRTVWDNVRSVADISGAATPCQMLRSLELELPETSAGRRGRIAKMVTIAAHKDLGAPDVIIDLTEDTIECLEADWSLGGLVSKCIARNAMIIFEASIAWSIIAWELYWSEVKT